MIAEQLNDKKIRILVGLEVDPKLIPDIVKNSRDPEVSFAMPAPWPPTSSALQLKQNYMDALVGFVNDSDAFDSEVSTSIFDMLLEKFKMVH